MAIKYQDIRNERQWKASTGLNEKQFLSLAKMFGEAYEQLFGETINERQNNSTSEATFKTYEDLLFFTLYSIKSGLTYDLLGLTFGLDGANLPVGRQVPIKTKLWDYGFLEPLCRWEVICPNVHMKVSKRSRSIGRRKARFS